MIGGAAEFAVGREPQAGALLQAHCVLDRAIFRRRQRRLVDLAAREAPPRFEQRRRPQQAADMLGAEGWAQILRPASFQYGSRRRRLKILPDSSRGSASENSITRGTL